jgi:hypothetical protein
VLPRLVVSQLAHAGHFHRIAQDHALPRAVGPGHPVAQGLQPRRVLCSLSWTRWSGWPPPFCHSHLRASRLGPDDTVCCLQRAARAHRYARATPSWPRAPSRTRDQRMPHRLCLNTAFACVIILDKHEAGCDRDRHQPRMVYKPDSTSAPHTLTRTTSEEEVPCTTMWERS